MLQADLARSWATLYLTTLELFTAPLRVLACPPGISDEERRARQDEVWGRWGEQSPPVSEVLFP